MVVERTRFAAGGIVLAQGVGHGIDHRAFLRGDAGKGAAEGLHHVVEHEAHDRVVLRPEYAFGIVGLAHELRVAAEFLEEELLGSQLGVGRECRAGAGVLRGLDEVVVPRAEAVHERKPLCEVLGVGGERAAVAVEPPDGALRVDGGLLGFVQRASRRLPVQVHHVGKLLELRRRVAHVGDVLDRHKPVFRPRRPYVRGRRADPRPVARECHGRLHRDLHRQDALRRQRLALAVVVELHRLPDVFGDVVLAAEHRRHRLTENRPCRVVGGLDAAGTEQLAHLVALGDGHLVHGGRVGRAEEAHDVRFFRGALR